MKKQNKNVLSLSERDFTELMAPKRMHHFDLPSEVIPDDENSNALKETLAGMEYDIESREGEGPDADLEYLLDNDDIFGENLIDDEDDDEGDEGEENILLAEEEDQALKHEATP